MSEELDPELVRTLQAEFCVEASDQLDNCEAQLLKLEQSASDDAKKSLKASLHNLKGSSRAVGLVEFSQIVHALESEVIEKQLDQHLVSHLLASCDALRTYIGEVKAGNGPAAVPALQQACGMGKTG